MGRDQEFLDAARSGNIALIEKVLAQKAKRAGPLASLRRGPGVNVQDSGGYSALHHACINGHHDIVRLLLAHEASPNLPDSRGSSPLHLAAWAGHQEIVKMLLTHPYRPGNPNLQTIENETPLHCAAQHGHTGALAVLLSHEADPNMRNTRGETPLDLAAQYGRLQAVKMLIHAHPELIAPYSTAAIEGGHGNQHAIQHKSRHSSPLPHSGSVSTPSPSSPSINSSSPPTPSRNIFPHTSLHLASRNGHKNVVEVLLAAGVCVNLLTPSGTALHEAALCGKESVVKTLLRANIDLNATDAEGRTALDILREFPPHVTKHIIAVINNFRNQMDTDDGEEVIYRQHNSQQQQQQQQQQQYQRNANSSGYGGYQKQQQHNNHYHFNSNNHLLNHSHSMQQAATHGKQRYSNAFTSGGGKSLDSGLQPDDYCGGGGGSSSEIGISPSSSMSSFEPTSVSPRSRSSTGGIAGYGNNGVPHLSSFAPAGPPKKPPRRNLSVSPTHAGQQFSYTSPNHYQNQGPSKQKQLRSPSNESPYGYHQSQGSVGGMSFDETQMRERQRSDRLYASARESTRSGSGISMSSSNDMLEKRHCTNEDYDENTVPNKKNQEMSHSMKRPLPPPRNIQPISKDIINCENPILKSYNPNRKLKRNRNSYSLSIGDKDHRSMSSDSNSDPKTQIPLSPTNYQQPPTPDHPPPSSSQAERTIHERIRPLSVEYKRRSAILLQRKHLMIDSSTSPPRSLPTSVSCQQTNFPPPPPQYGNEYELTGSSTTTNITPTRERLFKAKAMQGSTGSISSSTSGGSEHSASSNCVEEFVGDIPFAGLFKGSTVNVVRSQHTRVLQQQQKQQGTRPPLPTKPTIPERKMIKPKVIEPVDCNELNENVPTGDSNNHSEKNNNNNLNNNNNNNNSSTKDDISHQSFNSCADIDETHNESSNEDGLTLATSKEGSILSPFNAEEARKKISEIIESFGSGILNTNVTPTHDIELDFDDLDVTAERHELAVRLRSAGLLHLERMLFENGYDNFKFVNGVFEENDIKLMHIPDLDGSKLMRFVFTLPKAEFQPQIQTKTQQGNKPTSTTTDESKGVSTLAQWLQSISLPEYLEFFNKHLYNTIDSVCGVWDVELQTVLEINKLGHRRRILQSLTYIRQIRGEIKAAKTPLGENTEINKMATSNGATSNGDKENRQSNQQQPQQQQPPPQPLQQPQSHRSSITSYRKSRPAPQPPQPLINKPEPEPPLQIRAPSELLLDLPTDLRTKWRHSANALLNEQIKYEVYYLGSTVVKESRGTESTRKSIDKLKRIMAKENSLSDRESIKRQRNKLARNSTLNKPRKALVCLAISYRGVEFINMENRRTICEHEIQNINCACQDSDDLKHFAYITKENDQHFCHVFFVDSTDLATEIILTLGQAFEVAYQLALRDGITNTTNENKILLQGSESTKPEPQ